MYSNVLANHKLGFFLIFVFCFVFSNKFKETKGPEHYKMQITKCL